MNALIRKIFEKNIFKNRIFMKFIRRFFHWCFYIIKFIIIYKHSSECLFFNIYLLLWFSILQISFIKSMINTFIGNNIFFIFRIIIVNSFIFFENKPIKNYFFFFFSYYIIFISISAFFIFGFILNSLFPFSYFICSIIFLSLISFGKWLDSSLLLYSTLIVILSSMLFLSPELCEILD